MSYHLAQVNIARMNAPLDQPEMAGFVAQLTPVNAIADASPGFVWRLQGAEDNATAIRVFEDTLLLINLSVWESVEALHAFTYHGEHLAVYKARKAWFGKLDQMHMALWWIAAGSLPTPADAVARLRHLDEHGATPFAFTFTKRFTPEQALAYAAPVDAT